MAAKPLETLAQRRQELASLPVTRDTWPGVEAWHVRTRPLIAQCFPRQLGTFDRLATPSWTPGVRILDPYDPARDAADQAARHAEDDVVAAQARDLLLSHLDAVAEVAGLDNARPERARGLWRRAGRVLTGRSGFMQALAYWVLLAAAAATLYLVYWTVSR